MDLTVNQWLAGFDPQMRSQNFVPWWCNGNTTDFDSVVLGSNPSRGAKQCLFRSMDRIRCYERRDGGSIPSRGAKYGDSSGLRSSLARKMSTRVRFPGSPPKYGSVVESGLWQRS